MTVKVPTGDRFPGVKLWPWGQVPWLKNQEFLSQGTCPRGHNLRQGTCPRGPICLIISLHLVFPLSPSGPAFQEQLYEHQYKQKTPMGALSLAAPQHRSDFCICDLPVSDGIDDRLKIRTAAGYQHCYFQHTSTPFSPASI